MGCQQSVEEEAAASTAPVSPSLQPEEEKLPVSNSEEVNEPVELLNNALNGMPLSSSTSRPSSSASRSKERMSSASSRHSARSNRSDKTAEFVEPSLPGAIPDEEETSSEKVDKETGEEILNTSRTNSSMSNGILNGELEKLKKVAERPCTPSPASATSVERKLSGKSINGDNGLLNADHIPKDSISADAQNQLERQQSVGSLAKLRSATDELPKISEDEELTTTITKEETGQGSIILTLSTAKLETTNSSPQNITVNLKENSFTLDNSTEAQEKDSSMTAEPQHVTDKKVSFEPDETLADNDEACMIDDGSVDILAPVNAQLKTANFEEFDELPADDEQPPKDQASPEEDLKSPPNAISFPESNPVAKKEEAEEENKETRKIHFPDDHTNEIQNDDQIDNTPVSDDSQWKEDKMALELTDEMAEEDAPCSLAASSSGLVLPRPMTSYKKLSQHVAAASDREDANPSAQTEVAEKEGENSITSPEVNIQTNAHDLESSLSNIEESTSPPVLSSEISVNLSGSATKYQVTDDKDELVAEKMVENSESIPLPKDNNDIEVSKNIEEPKESPKAHENNNFDNFTTKEDIKIESNTENNGHNDELQPDQNKEDKQSDPSVNEQQTSKAIDEKQADEQPIKTDTSNLSEESNKTTANVSHSSPLVENTSDLKDVTNIADIDLEKVGRILSREISSVSQSSHIEDAERSSMKAEVLGF